MQVGKTHARLTRSAPSSLLVSCHVHTASLARFMKGLKVLSRSRQRKVYPLLGNDHDDDDDDDDAGDGKDEDDDEDEDEDEEAEVEAEEDDRESVQTLLPLPEFARLRSQLRSHTLYVASRP